MHHCIIACTSHVALGGALRSAYLVDRFLDGMILFRGMDAEERLCMAEVLKPVLERDGMKNAQLRQVVTEC